MKALRLHGHRDIRLDEVPDPVAPPGWAVIRVEASSICHSDLREWEGPSYIGRTGEPSPLTGVYLPVTLGHEAAGTIVEINGAAPGFEVGDRVVPDCCVYDRTCWYCLNGRYNLCDNIAVLGFDGHGSHAQFMAVPHYALSHFPDDASMEVGALIEPLAVAVHGYRQSGARVGDVVAILGAGMIGLCTLAVAKASGASRVFVSEPMPNRRARAKAMGAEVLDPSSDDVAAAIRDATGGHAADVAIDCVGAEASLNSALGLVRRGGRVALVGILSARPTIDIDRVGLDEVELVGSLAYAYDFPRAIALVADGRIRLDGFVTGRTPLRDIITGGFETMEREPDSHTRIVVDTQAV